MVDPAGLRPRPVRPGRHGEEAGGRGGRGLRGARSLALRSRRTVAGAAFLAPALVLLGALVVYPALATVVASFRDRTGDAWVGLANYRELAASPRMLLALRNNAVWALVVPSLVTATGLVLAVATERVPAGRALRTAIFMPMAISFLASGVIWRLMYDDDPRRGLLNAGARAVSSVVRPPGPYAGASPSGGLRPDMRSVARVSPGSVVQLGLVAIAAPDGARDARVPPARPGRVTGVVFRDFAPGGVQTPGTIDPGEAGLPGVRVRVAGAEAVTARDGVFSVRVPPGSHEVVLARSNFRPAFGGIEWLGPGLVTPAVMAAYVWMWAGFATVVVAAGLAAVPRELLEAARVDGAGEWQVFRRVTVPLLAPVLGVVLVTMLVNVLKVFDIVLVVAPPGSQSAANVIALEMWRTAFGARDQGLGAAVAVLLFVLVLPVAALNVRRLQT